MSSAAKPLLANSSATRCSSSRQPIVSIAPIPATPSGGIQDSYAGASVVVAGVTAQAVWHDFEAEDGGASYGDELDLSLTRKFGQDFTGMLKYADYSADGFAVDTKKFWLQLQLDF